MAGYGLYSRFIAVARIVLPLAALALLSSLFLFAREPGREISAEDTPENFEEIARAPRIGGADYAGLTADGTAIRFMAETARPAIGGPAEAEAVTARFDMAGGLHVDVTSQKGFLDLAGGNAVLEGDVVILTSTEWHISTERLTATLDRTHAQTDGPISATGPIGRLDAGEMELDANPAAPGSYVLVFKNGVKLVYDPDA